MPLVALFISDFTRMYGISKFERNLNLKYLSLCFVVMYIYDEKKRPIGRFFIYLLTVIQYGGFAASILNLFPMRPDAIHQTQMVTNDVLIHHF